MNVGRWLAYLYGVMASACAAMTVLNAHNGDWAWASVFVFLTGLNLAGAGLNIEEGT